MNTINLRPLLFLVYINDLTDNISSNIKLFADDSSLFTNQYYAFSPRPGP